MTRSIHAMSHEEKTDQDLLLLAHGALPAGARLRMSAHLKRCPECRARLAGLAQASSQIASAVRGPSLPAWSRADAVSRAARPGRRLVLPALIVFISLAVALFVIARTAFAPSPYPAARAAVSGCRPDLPNSRCK